MEQEEVRTAVGARWSGEILPSLAGLVEIPALSPAFDPAWAASGQLDAAVEHVRAWIGRRGLPGARTDVIRLPGRSPLLLVDVPATAGASGRGTVLLYGHLDKQPPVGGWADGLGPWRPVFRDGRLYGRGAVDDGYAGYAATAALEAVHAAGGQHARAVVLLETGEESGSPDLPAYMEHLADRLGEVTFVVCLDGGGGDYERMWLTSSLRGLVSLTVTVRVLDTAQHSGLASGIVPSSFRIMRLLLDRLEDAATGEVKVGEMTAAIPPDRVAEAAAVAALDPGAVRRRYPLVPGMRAAAGDDAELILNNTWRPTLFGDRGGGAAGAGRGRERAGRLDGADAELPHAADRRREGRRGRGGQDPDARTCPTARRSSSAASWPRTAGTRRRWHPGWPTRWPRPTSGCSAPRTAAWASAARCPSWGCWAWLYPAAQILITGALGADSNAHVPDEWLNIRFAEQITESVAYLLDAHGRLPQP